MIRQTISAALTAPEAQIIEQEAARLGLNRSDYLRSCIFACIEGISHEQLGYLRGYFRGLADGHEAVADVLGATAKLRHLLEQKANGVIFPSDLGDG